jgi:predicted lipid-binding transport protein (Tim44 family)
LRNSFAAIVFVYASRRAYLYRERGFYMGATGSFPIDLILFGMIAAFLVLRLRSILGRRTGFEKPAQPYQGPTLVPPSPTASTQPEVTPSTTNRVVPDPATPVGQVLTQMRALDRSFDPARFLSGAEHAFRLIVTAFAAGDRTALRTLLADDTYRGFEQAISARESAGHTQVSEIRGMHSMTIEDAALRGSVASIVVRLVSDQTSVTNDKSGHPVAGADAVTEITDLWTFERDLAQTDPTWRLVAARSA